MIAGRPTDLDPVGGDSFLFADGVSLQAFQVLWAKHARRWPFDAITAEGDAPGEETHQVPRLLRESGSVSPSLSARGGLLIEAKRQSILCSFQTR